jgi:outer membrane protein assembly factor BamB
MHRQALYIAGCLVVALAACARKPLTPVTPWADVANDSLSFFTVSTDPGGLKVCYVFDWGNGSTSATGYLLSGDTGWCSHEFADTAAHSIRVKTRNEKGAESDWSPPLTFHPSQPPQLADSIVGRRHWAADRWYHASVRVTDPDGDSVAVRFVWGDLPAAGWSAYVPSDSVATDSCRWTPTGPHTVHVVLRDGGCMVSRPSVVETVSVSAMAVLWRIKKSYVATPTLGSIDGEPVLFCENDDDFMDCYDLDGRLRWSVPMPRGTGYAASASQDGSRLYVTTRDSGLVCLDSRTGQRRWCLSLNRARGTPALGPDGAVYVVAGQVEIGLSRVRDLDGSSVVEWSVPFGDSSDAKDGPVVGRNGVVYATGYSYTSRHSILVAVDPAGAVLWKDTTHNCLCGAPALDSKDRILIANEDHDLYCLEPDGALAWSVSTTNDLWPGCIAVGRDDEVIVADQEGKVMCFDSAGRQQWASSFETDDGWNTPCIAQDSTTIVYNPGELRGIGSYGQTLWEFSIWDSLRGRKYSSGPEEGDDWPSPVIGPNGDLYVASEDGLFRLAHGGLRLASTAWPTYNHDNAHSGWAGRP